MRKVKRMFFSNEWHVLPFSAKSEGRAISKLVSYQESFWVGVEEVCAINKPLVKALCLVDGDKPAIGYLYETMYRAKESICACYEDKGDEGYKKLLLLWRVIDERWNNTLHHSIHAAGISLDAGDIWEVIWMMNANKAADEEGF
jgi:hypothetical protein